MSFGGENVPDETCDGEFNGPGSPSALFFWGVGGADEDYG